MYDTVAVSGSGTIVLVIAEVPIFGHSTLGMGPAALRFLAYFPGTHKQIPHKAR